MRIRHFMILAASISLIALASATSADAGVIDGSLNNVHVLDGSNVLSAMVSSQLSDSSNNNANTKADGKANLVIGRNGSVNVGADIGPGRHATAKSRRRT